MYTTFNLKIDLADIIFCLLKNLDNILRPDVREKALSSQKSEVI